MYLILAINASTFALMYVSYIMEQDQKLVIPYIMGLGEY
jgi:hypothetical protein